MTWRRSADVSCDVVVVIYDRRLLSSAMTVVFIIVTVIDIAVVLTVQR